MKIFCLIAIIIFSIEGCYSLINGLKLRKLIKEFSDAYNSSITDLQKFQDDYIKNKDNVSDQLHSYNTRLTELENKVNR